MNIMALHRMTATCPLKVEMGNYLSKWTYISIEKIALSLIKRLSNSKVVIIL